MEKKIETTQLLEGLYKDDGKENGNYYLGLWVKGWRSGGDLLRRVIRMGRIGVTIWVIGVISIPNPRP